MKTLTKSELQKIIYAKYGDVKFEIGVKLLKDASMITVLNRNTSGGKKYIVCEAILD